MAEVSFGEWLRRRRKALDLTQEQLARQISCSTSALRKIEAEVRRPSEQTVEQLAEVLQIPSHERASFLKFARGNWETAPAEDIEEEVPWHTSNTGQELPNLNIHLATFLFTDIVGSLRHWESAPEKIKQGLQRHHEILKEAVSSGGGNVFQIVGDSVCAVFPTALSAISAAVTAQRALYQEPWDLPFPIRVRMGLHTGEAERTPTDSLTGGYASNPTLNRVARILNAGHGGQILLSQVTKELVKDSLPPNTELRDLGEHHFRYLTHPEHLFQLNIDGLPADFPPLNTLDVAHHNLPVQLTSFIGRKKEIAELRESLAATPSPDGREARLRQARLITLTGPGGTGKTRLSIEVAGQLLDQYPDGVRLAELAPIFDPTLLPRTVAFAIGLREEPHRPVIDMLCDYLREKKILLVLDNCEHLIEACAPLADILLHACPHIHILASSREPLRIAGETVYLVPSLELPDIQNGLTAQALSQFEAIRLFTERASAATQNFKMTDENASSIAQICHRLDGMPLAIELAASKVRTLSVGQIAQRLDDRFDLLTGGSRMALPRHQTLQAAIEWSYNLLAPGEQILFRRLSVFVGGWTLEAAEAVCSDQDATTQGALRSQDILPLLTQLVNKSLVTVEERNGEVRYHLLETIRQYAHKELLRTGDENQVQTYHLEFFAKFSEDAEPRLLGKDQLIWLDRLEQEIDNIRAALDWSVKSRHIAAGLRLAGALWRFWDVRNCSREGRGRLLEILSLPEAMARTKERAKALHAAGTLSHILSDHAAAGSLLLEGLAISQELQDKHATGYFLIDLAHTWGRYRGDMDDSELVNQSLEIFKEFGDRWGIALSLEEKGRIAFERDDFTTAISYRAESIRIYRELGDQISLSLALIGLANVIMYQGNYGRSGKLYEESLALFRQMRHRRGISISINGLGEVARCQESFSQAKAFYEESLGIAREIGDQTRIAISFHNLGYISQHQGDYQQAIALFIESLLLAQEIEDKVLTALCMIGLAGQLQALGYPIQAAHLFGAAQSIFDFTSIRFAHPDQLEYQRNLRETRAQLDEATFASAWEVGAKMTVDEALDLISKTVEAM